LVEKYLGVAPRRLSVFSYVQLFLWQDFFHFHFAVWEESLCIFAQNPAGVFLYWPPLGREITATVIAECWRWMREQNADSSVSRIENVCDTQVHSFLSDWYDVYNKGYEYCYFRKDIAALAGLKYKSKRCDYHACIRRHNPEYTAYHPSMQEECLALYDRWAHGRRQVCADEMYHYCLEDNRTVHRLALEHHDTLGLIGRVVFVDGVLKAYTFGYPLNGKVFCVLFEVTDLAVKGLPVYIFREFCADAQLQGWSWINVMDDFGMPNLTRTKMSFRPVVLLPAYTVTGKVVPHFLNSCTVEKVRCQKF
jgi:hypothetical protein